MRGDEPAGAMRSGRSGRNRCIELVLLSVLALGGSFASVPATALAQDAARHEVTLRVSDLEESAIWFRTVFGFRTENQEPSSLAPSRRLRLDEAVLILVEGGEAAPSAVIKLGLLIPAVVETFQRLRERYPDSVLVPHSQLPAVSAPSDWPIEHFIAVNPDGTMVQALGHGQATGVSRWLLAAVAVRSLDDAAAWYEREAGFSELLRPEAGDPRNLMRSGSFYLELGEFGGEHSSTSGVEALRLEVDRTDAVCTERATPQGYRLRACADVSGRPG